MHETEQEDGTPLQAVAVSPEATFLPVMPASDRLPANWWQYEAGWKAVERLCRRFADSDMVPAAYKDKPGNVFVALSSGMPLGLSPLACLQSTAVINGRPTLYGDAPLAMVLSHPSYVKHEHVKEGTIADGTRRHVYRVWRTINGNSVMTEDEFSIDDAKMAGLWSKAGPWKNYPDRMLLARCRTYCLRNAFADVLSGIQIEADNTEEEFKQAEVINVRSTPEVHEVHDRGTTDPEAEAAKAVADAAAKEQAKAEAAEAKEAAKKAKADAAAAKKAEAAAKKGKVKAADKKAKPEPDSEPGDDARDIDPNSGRSVLIAGDLQTAKAGDYRYDPLQQSLSVFSEAGKWVECEDQEASAKNTKQMLHHRLARTAKDLRFDRDSAMAWAEQQLGLTEPLATFGDLQIDQMVKLLGLVE